MGSARWTRGFRAERFRLCREVVSPKMKEAQNRIAVMRGPIVYCLESPDLPGGVAVHEVRIPRDIELTPKFEADLLGGVAVLEGAACRLPGPAWEGRLYAEAPRTACERLPIRLIPYYAWLRPERNARLAAAGVSRTATSRSAASVGYLRTN